jgi:hypothetical protein
MLGHVVIGVLSVLETRVAGIVSEGLQISR